MGANVSSKVLEFSKDAFCPEICGESQKSSQERISEMALMPSETAGEKPDRKESDPI